MQDIQGISTRYVSRDQTRVDHVSQVLDVMTSRRQLLKLLAAGGGTALLSHADLGSVRKARAAAPANDPFWRTWARTDKPVADGVVSRTWMWGPEAFTEAMTEDYVDSPNGQRQVQYFDKSRMEITHPDAVDDGLWYVTNGLLVVELITGRMQMGDTTFVQRAPAQVNVAGDPDTRPTYADFEPLLDRPARSEGTTIIERLQADGSVIGEDGLAALGVEATHYVPDTQHTVAGPFWDFMNSQGVVYENDTYVTDQLFINPFYATGFPITEAYWTTVTVLGTLKDVLVQCFERRVLTYTPDNPPGWQVEAGNVGQHYYRWRYGEEVFCVPASSDHKPKTPPEVKLRALADDSQIPSVLASAFFQMGRRFAQGQPPANDLEATAFDAFRNLSPDLRYVLGCSLRKFEALPTDLRMRLFDDRFGLDDAPVTVEGLAGALAEELARRASETLFGDPDCLMAERPGLARPEPGIEPDEVWFTPHIYRVNGLRTIEFGISLAEYTPEELQQQCSLVPIDTNGDGVPDDSQLNCEVQHSPCPGNELDGVCLAVPDVLPGGTVTLTGSNFFNVAARVRLQSGAITREVEAHVCGDITTPATEIVGGSERTISDSRVQDQLVFTVPADLPTGIYSILVIVPNNTGFSTYIPEFTSFYYNEYIRVVAPPTTTYQIASEELFADEETDGLGSDEVGLRIIAVPIELDGTLGELGEHRFGSGSLGIFGDVDSGETRDISRVLLQRNSIAGVALAIVGFEVDDEDAFQEQVQGFIDAFLFVMESSLHAVAELLVGAVVGLVGVALGLSAALVAAIAAVIVLAIVFFVALWAPADLIIEDMVGLSALDLDMLTSPTYPAPATATYTTGGDIGVTVEPIMKNVEYHEHRWYRSEDEDSRYRIRLRYNR